MIQATRRCNSLLRIPRQHLRHQINRVRRGVRDQGAPGREIDDNDLNFLKNLGFTNVQ
jgi:hypothetical protein